MNEKSRVGEITALSVLIFLGYYMGLKNRPLLALGMTVLTYLVPMLAIEFTYKKAPRKVGVISAIIGTILLALGFVDYTKGYTIGYNLLILGIFALAEGLIFQWRVSKIRHAEHAF
ncbi:hypothetical protein [Thermococcus sp. MAR1]|uniref:hypothetical protein n=1 Tax=Thermococcus sp. MAR1 TaxID=1638263 RepID=UPI00143B81EE|nr:hypothetical protein [Thermococcus sp. MAR1]NJE10304.1 hypothetical protein [Thermococcus sp. MAR1]